MLTEPTYLRSDSLGIGKSQVRYGTYYGIWRDVYRGKGGCDRGNCRCCLEVMPWPFLCYGWGTNNPLSAMRQGSNITLVLALTER